MNAIASARWSLPVSPSIHSSLFARTLPVSWILLWELPFWAVFLYSALVPASMVIKQDWFGIHMRLSDLLTIASAAFYGIAGMAGFLVTRHVRDFGGLLCPTFGLFIYGFLRLHFGPLEQEDRLAMGFALLLALSAPSQAAGVLSLYKPKQTKAFLNRLVLALAVVSLIYTAESVFGLGLRSEAGQNFTSDFGIQRVRGPLYGPSTGYFLLLPALGWALHSFFSAYSKKMFAVFCTVSLLAAYLGLGSRAGLILLVMYVVSVALFLRKIKRAESNGLLLAAFSLGAGLMIYSQADAQRLTKFEDNYRKMTYETALNIVQTESLSGILAGQGYGSIWPWYRRDIIFTDLVASGDNLIQTSFGPSLYHSHSTLLEVLVEFGFPGLVWLACLVTKISKLPFRTSAGTSWHVFSLALAISLLSFGFDLFLFKEVRVSSVWWLFVAAAFQMGRETELSEL